MNQTEHAVLSVGRGTRCRRFRCLSMSLHRRSGALRKRDSLAALAIQRTLVGPGAKCRGILQKRPLD